MRQGDHAEAEERLGESERRWYEAPRPGDDVDTRFGTGLEARDGKSELNLTATLQLEPV